MTFKKPNCEIAGEKKKEGVGMWLKIFTFLTKIKWVVSLAIKMCTLFLIIFSLISYGNIVHCSSFCCVNFGVELDVNFFLIFIFCLYSIDKYHVTRDLAIDSLFWNTHMWQYNVSNYLHYKFSKKTYGISFSPVSLSLRCLDKCINSWRHPFPEAFRVWQSIEYK